MSHSHDRTPAIGNRDTHWQIVPDYDEVEHQFQGLTDGSLSRENINDWASERFDLMDDNPWDRSPVNYNIFNAIKHLIGADMLTEDRPYLFGREDFEGWYADFKAGPAD